MMPLVVLCFVSGLAVGAPRPNIILIVTDDQRPDTIHALGNAIIQTPELDKLAARSFVFTRAYATYPICHVSRAQILTGCPAFRALPQYPAGAIDPKLATLPRTLQTAGYVTWYSGKWHNDGQPKARGYTATRGLYSSGAGKGAPVQPSHDARGRPLTGYRGWTFKTDDGRIELDKGVGLQPDNSRHIAEGAIQALRDTPRDQPFFLHVNFAFPHDPRQWPAGAEGQYRADQMPLPANFAPVHPFDHGNLQGRDELLLPMPREPDAVRE
ncbi:MAG: sulfatase-like hydrolase/transferase, partial [Pirellulaceae bacterium]